MKRFSLLILLCAIFGLFAPPLYADSITTYDALKSAIENGGEIQLGGDITVTETLEVPSGITVTLDLNGKTLTHNTSDVLNNQGTLTIIDKVGGGKIESKFENGIVAHGETTTFGSKEHPEYNNFSIEVVEVAVWAGANSNAIINIYGGTFKAADNFVLGGPGYDGFNNNTWNIYGGIFEGDRSDQSRNEGYLACGICAANDDKWNIEGGTFNITGGAGIVARAGVINIPANSTLVINTTDKAEEKNTTGKVVDTRIVVPCSAIVFDTQAGFQGMTNASKITIAGGAFSSEAGAIGFVGAENDKATDRIEVSGGVFTDDPTDYVPKDTDGKLTAAVVSLSDTTYKHAVVAVSDVAVSDVAVSGAETRDYDPDKKITLTAKPDPQP